MENKFTPEEYTAAAMKASSERKILIVENGKLVLKNIPSKTLEEAKADKWNEIKEASHQSRLSDTVDVNGMQFSISEDAKINLTSVTLMGQIVGEIQYFEKNGTSRTFSIEEFMPIALAIGQAIAAAETKYYNLEAQINACTTVEEVGLIKW